MTTTSCSSSAIATIPAHHSQTNNCPLEDAHAHERLDAQEPWRSHLKPQCVAWCASSELATKPETARAFGANASYILLRNIAGGIQSPHRRQRGAVTLRNVAHFHAGRGCPDSIVALALEY